MQLTTRDKDDKRSFEISKTAKRGRCLKRSRTHEEHCRASEPSSLTCGRNRWPPKRHLIVMKKSIITVDNKCLSKLRLPNQTDSDTIVSALFTQTVPTSVAMCDSLNGTNLRPCRRHITAVQTTHYGRLTCDGYAPSQAVAPPATAPLVTTPLRLVTTRRSTASHINTLSPFTATPGSTFPSCPSRHVVVHTRTHTDRSITLKRGDGVCSASPRAPHTSPPAASSSHPSARRGVSLMTDAARPKRGLAALSPAADVYISRHRKLPGIPSAAGTV